MAFTRNEDFGESRILRMEAKLERMVRDGAEFSTGEEGEHDDGKAESD